MKTSMMLGTLLAMGIASSAMAAEYVQGPPLRDGLKTSVSDCRTQATLNVPVIAWGGDIPTLVANGNSLTTQPDSAFDLVGIKVKLARQDVFAEQVQAYMRCDTPFLRGTQGMVNMAADITERDPRTRMVAISKLSWSSGGDVLVAKAGINKPADLKGKTIVLQAYGPHVEYLINILEDGGLKPSDVKIKWVKDQTGTNNAPAAAFFDKDVDAAFMISPDASIVTSNMTVGTGASGSFKGAHRVLSTKTANRLISDVYVVRQDYFDANRKQIEAFVHGLMLGEEETRGTLGAGGNEANAILASASEFLLGVKGDIDGAKGLYADAETTGFRGNVSWVNKDDPRSWLRVNNELQTGLVKMGLMKTTYTLSHAGWDYDVFKDGLNDTAGVVKPKFNEAELARTIDQMDRTGQLADASLFEFDIYFKPGKQEFQAGDYEDEFRKVIALASKYGGAVITVEGHVDPNNYLRKKQDGESGLVLKRAMQSAKNLSMSRAIAVQQTVIEFALASGISMDPSQFATLGKGIAEPVTGNNCVIAGTPGPCPSKTEDDWRKNMRVKFRIVRVEAEDSVFTPLN